MRVLYTAAHGVDGGEALPLGGGAAICRMLMEEWRRTQPFTVRVLGPDVLGARAPGGADLVRYSEWEYARFCRRFEAAVTEEVLRHDPRETVVLSNDVSEGPDFRRLAEAGFRIVTIYHVDVVAYVSRMYLRDWVKPETTVRWLERMRRVPVPDVLRLIWDKQRDSVRHSRLLVAPSREMRDVLERCYGAEAAGKVAVLPWGVTPAEEAGDAEVAVLRAEFGLPPGALVVLALSRISPEKGQDLLLEALLEWEQQVDFPKRPVAAMICGEAAYMQGRRHLERLRRLAGRLRKVKTFFPGHVTGERKRAFFGLADVYAFPSVHESYGLTLMEALAAGVPAVCLGHAGAREVMRPELGELVELRERAAMVTGLRLALARLLGDEERRRRMGAACREYARGRQFERTAARLGELLLAVR
ncbi:MAG: glycosyltransferase family 4 protein [Bryobacterales bacterium]|nr:glycosyltransferase family 4 protein [Bryobacterales bacterium]